MPRRRVPESTLTADTPVMKGHFASDVLVERSDVLIEGRFDSVMVTGRWHVAA